MDEGEAEDRLLGERDATRRRLSSMDGDLAALAAAAAGSNLDDEHDPEGATVAFEREQLAALRARAEAHLADIEAALERLANHRYGTCERCGERIVEARLDVLPATRWCMSCAAKSD